MKPIELMPIDMLAQKKFIVESYQRGYKWSKKEILELLNDIHSFDFYQGIYCLQPIILKPSSDDKINTFEVIDGQQRTTTIYLLLMYFLYRNEIKEGSLYDIEYQTRRRSAEFLKGNLFNIFSRDVSIIENDELLARDYDNLQSVNGLWTTYTSEFPEYDNVDVYHFFVVACYIKSWVDYKLKDDNIRGEFIRKLLFKVHVIWYTLGDGESSKEVIKVFLNNNKGKIRLTSSELIKALCILEVKNNEIGSIAALRINQFAMEWDSVEKHLQDDGFWYFLQPDEGKYKNGTRIDFLFDLYFNREDNKDDYFAYRMIESNFQEDGQPLGKAWRNVVQLYYKLLNWYEDSQLYHLVGFITNANFRPINALLRISKGLNKEKFKEKLHAIIEEQFQKKAKGKNDEQDFYIYSLESLHYKNSYKQTLDVLLLYNVLYYVDNMASFKFPFDLFVKMRWSIEHINPQNPKDFESISNYVQWIEDLTLYSGESINSDLNEKIRLKNNLEELLKDKLLMKEIDQLVIEHEDLNHSIRNLLLLDKNTNSALGNAFFAEKRKKVLAFDKLGGSKAGKPIFIPIETLNAFNKVFSDKVNIENWTKEDGDAYFASIAERLSRYLPKPD